MKEIAVLTPLFYSRFQCAGSACPEHCCQRWDITIDKKTYSNYINSKQSNIKELALKNLQLTKKDHHNHAKVILDPDGNCPFLDSQKLCQIHRELGHAALSHTCKIYPRTSNQYQSETQHSLSMSCPEVVNQILFSADAMQWQEHSELVDQINKQKPVRTQQEKLVQLMAFQLLMADSRAIENNLFALNHLLIFLDKINYNLQDNMSLVSDYYDSLLAQLADNSYEAQRQKLNSAVNLKLSLLLLLNSATADSIHTRGREFLLTLNTRFIALFKLDQESIEQTDREAIFSELHQQWEKMTEHGVLSDKTILRNYFLYRLYHDGFPSLKNRSPLRYFYYLTADYFYLKTKLTMMDREVPLTQEVVSRLFYSYHTFRLHKRDIEKQLDHIINSINIGDDISALLLLK